MGMLGVLVCSGLYYEERWSQVWKEDQVKSLHSQIDEIVQTAIAMAPTIASDYLKYSERQEIERRKYEEQQRQEAIARQLYRIEALREKSRQELIAIIAKWEELDQIARFFSRLEAQIMSLPEAKRIEAQEKLGKAKELLLGRDPYAFFEHWQLPDLTSEPADEELFSKLVF